jgi:hypothetical protein
MHPGGSLEYQFAAASSREMIRDLTRVASSPSAYGGFVGHGQFAWVGVSMIFGWSCCSIMWRPWCKL